MQQIWKQVLETLRERTNEHNFNLWFRPIQLGEYGDTNCQLVVPNRFLRDWIADHYLDIIERTFYEIANVPISISLEISTVSKVTDTEEIVTPKKSKSRSRRSRRPELGMPLHDRFTFESFVIGPSNEFSHAAAKAVATHPGKAYNPLFIYGSTGLGKTHLLHAIGHDLIRRHSRLKVAFVTSERFMNEMITAIATNQMLDFRRRYRDLCDVLLIDDIQFIAGKRSTQEEFFHTFNFLFESGKQVVVTSDQYPQEIKTLDERIRSRLHSGLVADIRQPDLETRVAILQKKMEMDKFETDSDVIHFLAKNIRSNVRELEGSLVRLEAFSSLTGAKIDLSTAREVLKNFIQKPTVKLNCEMIIKRVCKHFNIKQTELLSRSRAKKVLIPRQAAMYLTRTYTELSLSEIGVKFGGKDHSTVINAIARAEERLSDDMSFRDDIKIIEKKLNV